VFSLSLALTPTPVAVVAANDDAHIDQADVIQQLEHIWTEITKISLANSQENRSSHTLAHYIHSHISRLKYRYQKYRTAHAAQFHTELPHDQEGQKSPQASELLREFLRFMDLILPVLDYRLPRWRRAESHAKRSSFVRKPWTREVLYEMETVYILNSGS